MQQKVYDYYWLASAKGGVRLVSRRGGSLGQGLVVMWEAGDAELELTDIQVQDVINAIGGGLIKVVAVEED